MAAHRLSELAAALSLVEDQLPAALESWQDRQATVPAAAPASSSVAATAAAASRSTAQLAPAGAVRDAALACLPADVPSTSYGRQPGATVAAAATTPPRLTATRSPSRSSPHGSSAAAPSAAADAAAEEQLREAAEEVAAAAATVQLLRTQLEGARLESAAAAERECELLGQLAAAHDEGAVHRGTASALMTTIWGLRQQLTDQLTLPELSEGCSSESACSADAQAAGALSVRGDGGDSPEESSDAPSVESKQPGGLAGGSSSAARSGQQHQQQQQRQRQPGKVQQVVEEDGPTGWGYDQRSRRLAGGAASQCDVPAAGSSGGSSAASGSPLFKRLAAEAALPAEQQLQARHGAAHDVVSSAGARAAGAAPRALAAAEAAVQAHEVSDPLPSSSSGGDASSSGGGGASSGGHLGSADVSSAGHGSAGGRSGSDGSQGTGGGGRQDSFSDGSRELVEQVGAGWRMRDGARRAAVGGAVRGLRGAVLLVVMPPGATRLAPCFAS